jgi:hypothetical protein
MALQRRHSVAEHMEEFGRLIRTSNDREPPKSIAYIVALSDPADAIELIRSKVANPNDKVEDIGRVSDELIKALKIKPGGFMRADERSADAQGKPHE